MHDGVSKLWIVRAGGGLDVVGCKDEVEAVDRLIRQALTWAPPERTAEVKAAIVAAVTKALTHLDPPVGPRTCNRHADCDAANLKARERGHLAAEHCHDEDCEDCFGS